MMNKEYKILFDNNVNSKHFSTSVKSHYLKTTIWLFEVQPDSLIIGVQMAHNSL